MPGTQVRLLGHFRVTVGDEVRRFSTKKAESLFAYLLLHRGKPVSRTTLATMLWPDAIEARAKKNLNTTLWRIKRAITGSSELGIAVTEVDLAIHPNQADVDLFTFRTLLASNEGMHGQEKLEALARAEKLHTGDFMEGFSDDWCEEERRYARSQYVGILKKLVIALKEARDYDRGAEYAQRVITLDPLDEDAHRELMLFWYLSGNRTGALHQYEVLRKTLRDELGVEPTTVTTGLWEHIRADIGASSLKIVTRPFLPTKEASDGYTSLPIIGRNHQISMLNRLLERGRSGDGGAAVLCGEPGVGKTKLVEALAMEALEQGFEVLSGKSPDIQDPPPYQVFIQALWPRLAVLENLGEDVPSTLVKLVETLSAEHIEVSRLFASGQSLSSNAVVTEALIAFLLNAYRQRPTLLILEDIDRIDRASADLLVTLLGRLSRSNLVLIASARTGERPSVSSFISKLVSEGALRCNLEGLSEEDTKKLIHAALRSKNIELSVVSYLWHQTAGNPFFVLEFLRLLCAEGTLIRDELGHWRFKDVFQSRTFRLPLRVQEVVRRRIDLLDESSRKSLMFAALIGMEVDFGLLEKFLSVSSDRLADSIEPLLNEHLLEETAGGFRFPHQSIRAVVLTMPSKVTRRMLHSKVGRLKEQSNQWKAEDLSWHFEEAGNFEKAAFYAEMSGDRARSVHANNDSLYWYTRTLEILNRMGSSSTNYSDIPRRSCEVLVKRQQILDLLGDRANQLKDIGSIRNIGLALGDMSVVALALSLQATLYVRLNDSRRAIEAAREARQTFRSLGDVAGEARSSLTIGLAYLSMGRYKRSMKFIRKALPLFKQTRSVRDEGNALFCQGTVLNCRSDYFDALQSFEQANQVFTKAKDPRGLAYCYLGKGVAFRFLGKSQSSEAQLLKGMEFFDRVGDRVGGARCLIQLALDQIALGKLREAVYNSRKALRVAKEAGDIRAQIIILNNLGSAIYRNLGDFGRARKCLEEALVLIARSCNGENLSPYQESMAGILLDEAKPDEALVWSKASLASCRPLEMGMGLRAETHYRLGCAHLELRNPRTAIKYLVAASKVHEKCAERPFQIRTLVALSRAHLLNDEPERALRCSRKALSLLKLVESMDQAPDVYWNLCQVLRVLGINASSEEFLQKGYAAVIRQASGLKPRMKARFLSNIRTNREILEAVERTWPQNDATQFKMARALA